MQIKTFFSNLKYSYIYRSNILWYVVLCGFVFSAFKKTITPSNELEQFRTDQTVATIAPQLETFRSLSDGAGNSFGTRVQLYILVATVEVLAEKYGYQRALICGISGSPCCYCCRL